MPLLSTRGPPSKHDRGATISRPLRDLFPYRPKAVLWHYVPQGTDGVSTPMRFVFADYELEPEARTLERHGRRIPVEPKVFDLLVYLIEHRERVVSPNELLDALWPGVLARCSIAPETLHSGFHC